MAPIQLTDNEQQSGCLSNIFSRFTRSNQPSSSQTNEKFIYAAVDPMEELPPYQDIVKVSSFFSWPFNYTDPYL
jgi:hypothetical protein